jgi:hypothetical protein
VQPQFEDFPEPQCKQMRNVHDVASRIDKALAEPTVFLELSGQRGAFILRASLSYDRSELERIRPANEI